MRNQCSVDGCDHHHMARGWCSAHYHRWRRTGDPGSALMRPKSMVKLDVAPIVALVRSTGTPVVRLLDPSLRRAYARALRAGRIGDLHADRIAARCGRTLDELYGPWWDEAAA